MTLEEPTLPPVVRAAGGVVWRSHGPGAIEVLIVHRPRYDDWTFPKGKSDPGEDDADCARREVTEETGLQCRLGPALTSTAYIDRKGRPKVVRYWLMSVEEGSFAPNDEVDEARWVTVDAARLLLTYDRDRDVLDAIGRAGLS